MDLAAVVAAEAERPRPVPVRVSIASAGDPGVLRGDTGQLARVVGNRLDNAARYAASSVEVAVTPGPRDGTVRLTVDDDGPGVPPGTGRGSSSASPAWTTAAPAAREEPGWGWRSSGRW